MALGIILIGVAFLIAIIAYIVHVLLHLRRVKNSFSLVDVAADLPDRQSRPTPNKELCTQKFDESLVPEKLDAIVIGSGIGGMATAALLGRAGWRVLVLEQHGRAGGCCHTFKKGTGFEFDSGIHFVGKMHEDSTNSKLLKRLTNGELKWASQGDNYDVVTIGEGKDARQFKFCVGLENLRHMLIAQFPDAVDVKSVHNFCDLLRDSKKMEFGQVLMKVLPIRLIRLLYSFGLFRSDFFTIGQKSTIDVIYDLTQNAELRTLLLYMIPAIGFDLNCSWCITAAVWMHYVEKGCYYPIGGSTSITYPLVSTIEANEGKLLVKCKVTSILCTPSGHAHGVRVSYGKTDKEATVYAPIIISGAGVPVTFGQLLPREVAGYDEYSTAYGPSLNMVFIGLNGASEELGLDARNYHFMPDRQFVDKLAEYSECSNDQLLDAVPPFYSVTFPSAKDPEYAIKYFGKSVCIMATPTNYANHWQSWGESRHKKRPEEYEEFKKTYQHAIWELALRHFPHLESKMEFMTMGTPLSIAHYLNAVGGSIASLPHTGVRYHPINCANLRTDTDVPGLYLTGQDIFSGGFAGALAAAAFTTAHLLDTFGGKNGVNIEKRHRKTE